MPSRNLSLPRWRRRLVHICAWSRTPDVQFGDFLDALERNAVIADDAVQRLHRRLNLPVGTTAPMVQRSYWEQVLAERNISLATPFRAQIERTAPSADSQPELKVT